MPLGPAPLGLVYFAGVKLAGYSYAGRWLNRRLGASKPRPLVFGIVRTVLGLVVGIAFGMSMLGFEMVRSVPLFYVALLPVRICEWLLVLAVFYGRAPISGIRRLGYAAAGSVWSLILDLPAIYAVFALPGGAWIC
jgi:hypothetical protein